MPSFTQIGQNPEEEFEKVGFLVFAKKNFKAEVGGASRKVIQLHSGNLGIQEYETYGVGVIGKNTLA